MEACTALKSLDCEYEGVSLEEVQRLQAACGGVEVRRHSRSRAMAMVAQACAQVHPARSPAPRSDS